MRTMLVALAGLVVGSGTTLALMGLRVTQAPSAEAPASGPVIQPDNCAPEPLSNGSGLRSELDAARIQAAVARGQLQVEVGRPVPWPIDPDPSLTPDRVRERVDALLAERPDVSLLEFDCSEYPCVAVLQGPHSLSESGKRAQEAMRSHLNSAAQRWWFSRSGDLNLTTTAIGSTDALDRESDIGLRVDYRMRTLSEDAMASAREDAPVPAPPTTEAEMLAQTIDWMRTGLERQAATLAELEAKLDELEDL